MSQDELLQQRLGAEQLRHLLIGPYDYERKLLAPSSLEPGSVGDVRAGRGSQPDRRRR